MESSSSHLLIAKTSLDNLKFRRLSFVYGVVVGFFEFGNNIVNQLLD